jgi:hypothetical protein
MGVVVTIAVVLVAWCACALVVGIVVGRAIALKPGGHAAPPQLARTPVSGQRMPFSYPERV